MLVISSNTWWAGIKPSQLHYCPQWIPASLCEPIRPPRRARPPLTVPHPLHDLCEPSHGEVEEELSAQEPASLHCSPLFLPSSGQASAPPTSPQHPQTLPMLHRPSLPLEQDRDRVTAMPRPWSGHPAPRPLRAINRPFERTLRTAPLTRPSQTSSLSSSPSGQWRRTTSASFWARSSATASGHRWRIWRREVDEPSRCDLFCSPNVELASSTLHPIAAIFSAATPVSVCRGGRRPRMYRFD
jgi:hypothetical protein